MKKKGTFQSIFSFAAECRTKMLLSVICAVVSVLGGLVPYLGVYQIILLFFKGTPEVQSILAWAAVCVTGYIVKLVFYGISTTFSHMSAYQILESIRLALTGVRPSEQFCPKRLAILKVFLSTG